MCDVPLCVFKRRSKWRSRKCYHGVSELALSWTRSEQPVSFIGSWKLKTAGFWMKFCSLCFLWPFFSRLKYLHAPLLFLWCLAAVEVRGRLEAPVGLWSEIFPASDGQSGSSLWIGLCTESRQNPQRWWVTWLYLTFWLQLFQPPLFKQTDFKVSCIKTRETEAWSEFNEGGLRQKEEVIMWEHCGDLTGDQRGLKIVHLQRKAGD